MFKNVNITNDLDYDIITSTTRDAKLDPYEQGCLKLWPAK